MVTKKEIREFKNSDLITYTTDEGNVYKLTVMLELPLGIADNITGTDTLKRIEEILHNHTLVRSFEDCQRAKDGEHNFVWKRPNELFKFFTTEEDDYVRFAVVVPCREVRSMVSAGYNLGIELPGVNKRLMTIDVDAVSASKHNPSPFLLDSIKDENLIQGFDDTGLERALVMNNTIRENDLARTINRNSFKVLGKMIDDPADKFFESFTNINLDEDIDTYDELVKFCKKHLNVFEERKIRRLVILVDAGQKSRLDLSENFRFVMLCQDLNKFVFTLNPYFIK